MSRATPQQPTHYQILNLPSPHQSSPVLTSTLLKQAYHRALLRHHPDKIPSAYTPPSATGASTSTRTSPFTVDQITQAYKTLSTPNLRAAYDRALRLSNATPTTTNDDSSSAAAAKADHAFRTGLDTLDLDDMVSSIRITREDSPYLSLSPNHTELNQDLWFQECRCGVGGGYWVTEFDLNEALEGGEREVIVPCSGCSLWVRVLFGVEEEEEEEEDEEEEEEGKKEGRE